MSSLTAPAGQATDTTTPPPASPPGIGAIQSTQWFVIGALLFAIVAVVGMTVVDEVWPAHGPRRKYVFKRNPSRHRRRGRGRR